MKYNTDNFQFVESMIQRVNAIISQENHIERPIILIGDSIVQQIPEELLSEEILNHGISGMTSQGLKTLIDLIVVQYNPRHVYIHVGTNDLGHTVMSSPRQVALNVAEIIHIIQENIPDVKITMISTLPCDEDKEGYKTLQRTIRSNDLIDIINKELQKYSNILGVEYVDLNSCLINDDHQVRTDLLQEDGLHINQQGYQELFKHFNKTRRK